MKVLLEFRLVTIWALQLPQPLLLKYDFSVAYNRAESRQIFHHTLQGFCVRACVSVCVRASVLACLRVLLLQCLIEGKNCTVSNRGALTYCTTVTRREKSYCGK